MIDKIINWILFSLATGFVVLVTRYVIGKTNSGRFRSLQWPTFGLATGLVVLMALYTLYKTDTWALGKIGHGFLYGYRPNFTYIEDRAKRIVVSSSPRLVADYYATSDRGRPLILLLHGSSPQGRRSPFMRLLAHRIHADGFPVLALDLRGFGESEDPSLPLADDFRFEEDVLVAAGYALERGWAQPGRIIYMGFSLGGGVALRSGRLEPRPAVIIAVGAPEKRTIAGCDESWRREFAVERFRDMKITPDDQSLEVMVRYLIEMEVVTQVSRGKLPPVLLIYGEREKRAPCVQQQLSRADVPYKLYVVPQAPHAYYAFGGPWGSVFYNQKMVAAVATAAENWILSHQK